MANERQSYLFLCGILSIALFFFGCSDPPSPAPEPKVVRKAIQQSTPSPTAPAERPKTKPPAIQAVTPEKQAAVAPEVSPMATRPFSPAKKIVKKAAPAHSAEKAPEARTSVSGLQSTLAALVGVVAGAADSPGTGYNPKGKIDPFEPLFSEEKAAQTKPKKLKKRREPMTPLEKVDLSQLKLVAIIRTKTGNMALVEEASGKGYIVEKGTYIGVNSGQVVEIRNNGLIVEEETTTVLGDPILQHRELRLPNNPGE